MGSFGFFAFFKFKFPSFALVVSLEGPLSLMDSWRREDWSSESGERLTRSLWWIEEFIDLLPLDKDVGLVIVISTVLLY